MQIPIHFDDRDITPDRQQHMTRNFHAVLDTLPVPYQRLSEALKVNVHVAKDLGNEGGTLRKGYAAYHRHRIGLASDILESDDPSGRYKTSHEELTHYFDQYLGFTGRTGWCAAVSKEMGYIPSKVLLATERMYNMEEVESSEKKGVAYKPLPQGEKYQRDVHIEWLPDIIRTEAMIKSIRHSHQFIEPLLKDAQNQGITFPSPQAVNDYVFHIFFQIYTDMSSVAEALKGAEDRPEELERRFEQTRKRLEREIMGNRDIILGAITKVTQREYPITDEQANALLTEYFPETFPLLEKFRDEVMVAPWKCYWHEDNRERISGFLKEGTTPRELKAVVQALPDDAGGVVQKEMRRMLEATYRLHMLAGGTDIEERDRASLPSLLQDACLDAVIDNQTPMERAVKRENYYLAGKIRDRSKDLANFASSRA